VENLLVGMIVSWFARDHYYCDNQQNGKYLSSPFHITTELG
jgi:hypothetical protein